ncbi:MAG TPA: DUF58 domain-containing protein [Candidatus Limnocylindrales bacterium]|nr:DUF58 domain-containing protein [Candidatus Limnocylindrales bacterium]
MAGRVMAAIALIVVGSLLTVPIAILLGVVILLLDVVHAAWERQGLAGIRYARRLGSRRTPFGEPIDLDIEVHNRRRLPVAWLRADDEASPGVEVRERDLEDGEEPGTTVLRNAWTLRPWERVRRRFHVFTEQRGVFTLGPVDLSIGDPFARRAAEERRGVTDTFTVWPRTIPTTELEPPDRWGDLERARGGLAEDPARFAGVRPYAPGDPLRRIHARASARTGAPVTKRFEPSRDREVLLALDVQTADGAAWDAGWADDDVEALYVVAASIARSLALRRVAFGIIAAGYAGAETRIASVPVSSAPGQAERVLDLLARLSGHASMPFERLLTGAARTVRPGTTVLVLTMRDPRPFVMALRRLELAGGDVVLVAAGRQAARDAGRARQAGIAARRAILDGHWRTAERLVIGR